MVGNGRYRELIRQGCAPHLLHWASCPQDMGKSDPPDAPDYAAAAAATATGNADAARIAAKANRVSQYTPYGNLVYSQQGGGDTFNQAGYDNAMQQYQQSLAAWNSQPNTTDKYGVSTGVSGPAPVAPDRNAYIIRGGDPDVWRSDVTLAPAQQQMLEQQNQISLGLGDTMNRGLGYVQDMLDTPLSTEGFTNIDPASVAGREQVTNTMLERLQPGMDRTRQARENALMIQGHNRGGEAWNATQDDLSRAENDQRMAAVLAGGTEQSRLLGLQQAQRQNQLAELQTLRNEPLATLNAVRTGAMPTNPQFTSVPQQQTTAGPNLLGAAQQQYGAQMNAYNADQAQNGAMMSGLFSLGGAVLGSPWAGGMFGL